MNHASTVLILDANQRSALAATRSLGKQLNTVIITADETPIALAQHSLFSTRYVQYPSPRLAPTAFCQWLVGFVADHNISAVYPMTEISSQLVMMHKEQLGECKIPFADYKTVMSIANKWHLVNLAEKLDIPHPATEVFSNSAEFSLSAVTHFPVVLKPCLSHIWLEGEWLSTAVHIVDHADQLEELLNTKAYFKHHPFMLQEFIPGHGAGIFALYNKGEAVTFFAHQRIREKPPGGGVSVLSASRPCDPSQLRYAKALLDGVNWHGVAMVEFRISEDGTPYLMEVNTRFWGSLQLSIDAGVDFPSLLHQITFGENPTPARDYTEGQRLRWLLGDVDSLYLVLRSQKYSWQQKLRRMVDFLTPHPSTTRHEVNRLGDLGPAWFELKEYIGDLLRRR